GRRRARLAVPAVPPEPGCAAAGGEVRHAVRHRAADYPSAADDRACPRHRAEGDADGPPRGVDEEAAVEAAAAGDGDVDVRVQCAGIERREVPPFLVYVMDVVRSVNGVPVRLPEERWEHITRRHEALELLREELLETVRTPFAVLQGDEGEDLA